MKVLFAIAGLALFFGAGFTYPAGGSAMVCGAIFLSTAFILEALKK